MATERKRQLSGVRAEIKAKVQSKKNARRKAKKRMNAHLRERGEKYSHKDACYEK